MGYIENVFKAAECNMMAAIEEIQCLPHYSTKGEVRMYRFVCYTVYIYIYTLCVRYACTFLIPYIRYYMLHVYCMLCIQYEFCIS